MVEFAANGSSAPGYLATPDGEGPFPGVVVIQEWWGLESHIKDVTRRFAAEGFMALAPDLYRGQVAEEPDDARRLVMELNIEQAMKDIQGAVNYLNSQPNVTQGGVGVVGFCFGGTLSGMMSYAGKNIGAVVAFYGGRLAFTDENTPNVSVPVLAIYGEEDQGIPLELVRANEEKLREYGKTHEVVIYPDAPHAFFNDVRSHTYVAVAAEDAWNRTISWFRRYLTPEQQ